MEVQTRLSGPDEITWDRFKNSMMDATKKICGTTRGQKRREREIWWRAEDVQTAVKNKKTAYKKWQKIRLEGELRATDKAMSKETIA